MRRCAPGNSGKRAIARCTLDCLSFSSSRPDKRGATNQQATGKIKIDFGRMKMAARMDTVALTREAIDLKVWMSRLESRIDRVR